MQGFAGDRHVCSEGTAWVCSGEPAVLQTLVGFLRVLDANPVVTQVDLHFKLIQHMGEVSQFRHQQKTVCKRNSLSSTGISKS